MLPRLFHISEIQHPQLGLVMKSLCHSGAWTALDAVGLVSSHSHDLSLARSKAYRKELIGIVSTPYSTKYTAGVKTTENEWNDDGWRV